MKLQLIKSPHMASAMTRVMNELGPDALIYRTRSSNSGVEILAGLPCDGEEFDHIEQSISMIESHNSINKVNIQLDDKMKEIDLTVKMLNKKLQLLDAKESIVRDIKSPVHGSEELEVLGFDKETIREHFYSSLKKIKDSDDIDEKIKAIIAKNIHVTHNELFLHNRCIAIVGPTGVGKTTTVVKLALRSVKEFGANDVGIITTDESDVGVKNVLNFYCNIYGIDLEYVSSPEEMKSALKKMKNKRSILIDTHGVSQRDEISVANLKGILDGVGSEIAVYLALPAQQQEKVLNDIIRKFTFTNLRGCIITKLDEAVDYCPVISAVIKSKLTITYVCDGQDIKANIWIPKKSNLLSLLYGKKMAEELDECQYQRHVQQTISLIGMGYF